jgi:MoxR-like ATPase
MKVLHLGKFYPPAKGGIETILKLVRALRPGEASPKVAEQIAWGPGPRASQALMLMVRARALLDGRFAPSLDDVEALTIPTLQHRMAVTFAARAAEGITVRDLISTTLKAVL